MIQNKVLQKFAPLGLASLVLFYSSCDKQATPQYTTENPNNVFEKNQDTLADVYPFYEFIAENGSIVTYHDIDNDTRIDYVDVDENGLKVRYTATSTNKKDIFEINKAQKEYALILTADTYDAP